MDSAKQNSAKTNSQPLSTKQNQKSNQVPFEPPVPPWMLDETANSQKPPSDNYNFSPPPPIKPTIEPIVEENPEKNEPKAKNKIKKTVLPLILIFFLSSGIFTSYKVFQLAKIRKSPEVYLVEPSPTPDFSWIDLSQLITEENAIDSNPTIVQVCHIGFWNRIPPAYILTNNQIDSTKVGEVQNTIQDRLNSIDTQNFETSCNAVAQSLKNDQSLSYRDIFYHNYFVACSAGNVLFNTQNQHIQEQVQNMVTNEIKTIAVNDGNYLDDDITLNDNTYISGYYLIKKLETNSQNTQLCNQD